MHQKRHLVMVATVINDDQCSPECRNHVGDHCEYFDEHLQREANRSIRCAQCKQSETGYSILSGLARRIDKRDVESVEEQIKALIKL